MKQNLFRLRFPCAELTPVLLAAALVCLCTAFPAGFTAFSGLVLAASGTPGADPVPEPAAEGGILWYDATQWGTEGRAWAETSRYFSRAPSDLEERLPDSVRSLSQHTSGMLVRFRANAGKIVVRYRLFSDSLGMPHMPPTGASGLDLYDLEDGRWVWAACTQPRAQEATDVLLDSATPEMRDYMLYLPLYNGIDSLYIGVPEGSEFHACAPRAERPVAYYGTSIAQGGCCSRPGNNFTAMLGRRLDCPVLNFGYSGSALMEPVVAEMLARLDPSVYVLDPVPNMSAELIDERAVAFIGILRAAHPETPIVMVDGRRYGNAHIRNDRNNESSTRSVAFRRVFDRLSPNDPNLYWVGQENQIGEGEDLDSTMDGSHLNDLGMYRMANTLEPALRPLVDKALGR